MRSTRFINRLLYSLRRYQDFVTYVAPSESFADKRIGKKTVTTNEVRLRTIVLPSMLSREFIQRLASIVANREFSYGGSFDQTVRKFILDRRLIRRSTWIDYEPKMEHFIVWNHRRWEIKKIERFDYDAGFIIEAVEVSGNPPLAPIIKSLSTRLVMSDSASAEKS